MYQMDRYRAEIDVADYVRSFVDVPRFLECCRVCPNYETRWTCPPYSFDPLTVWNAYRRLRLIGCKITPTEGETDLIPALMQVKEELFRELSRLEQEVPGSILLSAGSCDFCGACARVRGEACVHPERLRYSLESLGANVSKTAEELLGLPLQWYAEGKRPDYLALVCGLLEK